MIDLIKAKLLILNQEKQNRKIKKGQNLLKNAQKITNRSSKKEFKKIVDEYISLTL